MHDRKSAWRRWPVVLVVFGCSSLTAMAQTRPSDGERDNAGPMRERRLVQKLEQARQLLAPREHNAQPDEAQAVRVLQSLLDDPSDADEEPETDDVLLDSVPDGDRRVATRSLKSEARRLLGGLSTQGRQAYELLVGKTARLQLDAALANGDWHAVESVSRQFPHTAAGYDATVALGLRELDLGEPLAAARRFEEVRQWPQARASREPLLSLRLALACRLAGDDDRCREVLIELKTSHSTHSVTRRDGTELPWFQTDADALGWLDRWAGMPLRPRRVLSERRDEWPLTGGNAARTALAAPAVPSDRLAWSRSLLDDDDHEATEATSAVAHDTPDAADRSPTVPRGAWGRVRVEVRSYLDQQQQVEQPALCAAQPILVGDAVIVRTLAQLRAFRASDGQPLWHSAMIDPFLVELLGEGRRGRRPNRMSPELEGWLHKRVWEDVTLSSLSSDGDLVYSLQERDGTLRSPPIAWRGVFVSREFNKLVAIEAATGRLRWELGGPRGDHELPAAGVYFLGAPLPWRGQLFVLTDDGTDLRLVSLDPRRGELRWTQTLVPNDPFWSGIVRDTGLSPTVAGECLICPTGAGSVVAVDPVRRELRWQTVYRETIDRVPMRRFDFHPPRAEIESSWRQSVILAARDHLVVAPPDLNELLCLDARDGHIRWRRHRDEGLFLAGVTETSPLADAAADGAADGAAPKPSAPTGAVLVVTPNEVHAVRLSDGKPAWLRAVSIGAPAGNGVLLDGVLHLPLMTGEIQSIDARTGRTLARTEVASKETLGHLIAANGRILSQSATHVAAFPDLRQQQRIVAEALRTNAEDAAALEQRGHMHLHLGQRQRGLDDLRHAIARQPTARAKQTLAALLLDDLRWGDADDLEGTIRELETLLDDPRQRLLFARLRAASWQNRGELLASARELLKLADSWEPSGALDIVTGPTSARQDRWLAAELQELHAAMSDADRRTLDEEIAKRLQRALDGTGPARPRDFLRLFGWSSSASAARRALLMRIDPRKQRHEYEALLLAEGGAFGTARLAQKWLSLGQIELARPLIDDLATRFAGEPCLDGQTGGELAARWRGEFSEQLTTTWPTQRLKWEQVSNSEPLQAWYHLEWYTPTDTFRENWQLWRDAPGRAIVARDSFGREQWRTRLPFENYSTPHVVGLSATWHGRWLVLNLGERFLVLDTLPPAAKPEEDDQDKSPSEPQPPSKPDANAHPEPRLMWQSVLFDRRIEPQVTPLPARIPSLIPGAPDRFAMTDSSGRRLGRATIVGHDVVCYQTGHRLIASELATGDLLWTFDGLPFGCDLAGDERVVVVTNAESRELLVLSTLDGRVLRRQELGPGLCLATLGRHVLTWSDSELRLFDALTNADRRRERFPQGTLLCLSLGDSVAMLEPGGRFTIWSLRDGQRQLEQHLPPIAHVTHFVVLRDRERWLLLTNVEQPLPPDRPRPRVSLLNFDHWRVHGPAFAFERSSGRQLWSTALDWHGIQADQPADSPVLLLASRVQTIGGLEPRAVDAARFQVSVLDKRDGRVIPLAPNLRPDQRNFAEQRPKLAEQIIDVQIERDLHRLSFETR